jgi:hypothetical protein
LSEEALQRRKRVIRNEYPHTRHFQEFERGCGYGAKAVGIAGFVQCGARPLDHL